jgi:hypothetical protein
VQGSVKCRAVRCVALQGVHTTQCTGCVWGAAGMLQAARRMPHTLVRDLRASASCAVSCSMAGPSSASRRRSEALRPAFMSVLSSACSSSSRDDEVDHGDGDDVEGKEQKSGRQGQHGRYNSITQGGRCNVSVTPGSCSTVCICSHIQTHTQAAAHAGAAPQSLLPTQTHTHTHTPLLP